MTARSTTGSASDLPVIDVSGLSSSDPRARVAVGEELRRACLDKGFFFCTGHGVPAGLTQAVFDASRHFFDQPPDVKERVDKAKSPCNRGYERLGGQTLQADAKPDLKEGFYIGPDLPADHPNVVAGRFNQGPNQWPDDLPEFRPVMRAYYAAMLDLAERLMSGLALSLRLDEHYFDAFTTDPITTLRLLHYPPQPATSHDDQLGAGAHTDFGGLTILAQDDKGGLQVFDHNNGCWIDALPIDGAFIVNLGDMIARWTNDHYRSTLHRVINRSGTERYSVPFFFTGNPDHEVACLPSCLKPGETPNYPPIRVEDHLMAMYRKTYGTQ